MKVFVVSQTVSDKAEILGVYDSKEKANIHRDKILKEISNIKSTPCPVTFTRDLMGRLLKPLNEDQMNQYNKWNNTMQFALSFRGCDVTEMEVL